MGSVFAPELLMTVMVVEAHLPSGEVRKYPANKVEDSGSDTVTLELDSCNGDGTMTLVLPKASVVLDWYSYSVFSTPSVHRFSVGVGVLTADWFYEEDGPYPQITWTCRERV